MQCRQLSLSDTHFPKHGRKASLRLHSTRRILWLHLGHRSAEHHFPDGIDPQDIRFDPRNYRKPILDKARTYPVCCPSMIHEVGFDAALPSLEGKSVLDLGCGYGWHCKFAEEQGATKILGIDLSKKMIEEAQKRNSGNQIEYRISGLEEYDYPENEWDCVISNLALHYIEDIVEIFQKVYRTLKPGGIFLFNIEHPVFTAGVGQDWIYTDDGKPQYWAIDNYFITGERNTHFLGCDIVKQHHTLTQIIMGLLNNGFELKVVEEADFLEEFDPRYNEEGVSELNEQFERLPDGHEAKRSYYLGFRQAQSEARPNIVISLLKLN